MTTIGIVMMTLLFFTSCKKEVSTNVDKDRIYTNYDVSYDQQMNRTEVKATFRVDHSSGQKIELVYPARVDFDGDRLVYRQITGTYDITRTGNMLGRPITFTDREGNQFSNSLIVNSIDLPFGLTSISKNADFYLPWNGPALEAGETVTVTIGGRKFSTSLSGSTYIVLQRYELQNLVAGTAQIQIKREKENSLSQSNLSGGRISASYQSRKVTINITE